MAFWPSCFKVLDRRPPWAWGAEFVRIKNSPYKGNRFRPELTPWLKEPLECLPLNSFTEITCQCCVQGSKTVFILVGSMWAIEFEPDAMIITCQTDDDSKYFARERFNYAIERIPGIAARLPSDRSKKSICSISMSDMAVDIQGANPNNLNSKPIRWVFNDEVWLWKNGLLDEARKRCTRYWNRRIVNVSTAGEKGCDMDRAFEAGDKREWHLMCPACEKLNLPKWERIDWPKDAKLENGEWNYKEIKERTRFICEHCGVAHAHTHEVHKAMNDGARYVATNPNPTPGHVSFRWNALCLAPSELSWGDLAVEYLKAESEYAKGNEAPRREFVQKRLAESYDAANIKQEPLPTVKIEGAWPDEAYRFMTVDVQQTCFWYIVRAWAKSGESRLLSAGRLDSWSSVEARQKEFSVPVQCVFIDAAYRQEEVVAECAKRNTAVATGAYGRDWVGWRALDGENKETKSFNYKPKGKRSVLLPYSWPPKYLRGADGQYCKFNLWSNRTIKDILFRLRDGRGAKWLAYEGVPRDWEKQMYSERRIVVYDNFGRERVVFERIGNQDNHLLDCEAMQLVPAHMVGAIGSMILEDSGAVADN